MLLGEQILSLRVYPYWKEGKNETGRVASLENVPVHFKTEMIEHDQTAF